MSAELIIQSLKKLVESHKMFISLSDEKKDCLMQEDIGQLKQVMLKESALLKKMQSQEQERMRLVQFFGRSKGLVTENGTLSELLPLVSEQQQEELLLLQKKLTKLINELKEKNDLNKQLIEKSLRFVNLSLDVMQPQHETGNYGRQRDEDNDLGEGRSLFDSKA